MFCPHCGKEISEGQAFCQFCGAKVQTEAPSSAGGRAKTPWEEEGTQWTFTGLMATLKGALFSPAEFFRKMNVAGGLTNPLLYAMIVGMTGLTFSYLWQALLHDTYSGFLAARGAGAVALPPGIGMAAFAIIMPFTLLVVLFVWSGLLHVLLLLVRGARNGFEATFRAAAYGSSASIFLVVPFCGAFIWLLWFVVIVIIGLKEAHGTSGGKASFAVLFPLVICCVLSVLLVALFLGTVAASFGTLSQQPWK